MEFRLADFFSEKIIVGPHGVPDPPSLAQMTFTQCTSMSELLFHHRATSAGQIEGFNFQTTPIALLWESTTVSLQCTHQF